MQHKTCTGKYFRQIFFLPVTKEFYANFICRINIYNTFRQPTQFSCIVQYEFHRSYDLENFNLIIQHQQIYLLSEILTELTVNEREDKPAKAAAQNEDFTSPFRHPFKSATKT